MLLWPAHALTRSQYSDSPCTCVQDEKVRYDTGHLYLYTAHVPRPEPTVPVHSSN